MKFLEIDFKDVKMFFIILGVIFLIELAENIAIVYGRSLFINPLIGFVIITFIFALISTILIKRAGFEL